MLKLSSLTAVALALAAPTASFAQVIGGDSATFEAYVNGSHVCEISVNDRTFALSPTAENEASGSVSVEVTQNGDTFWELSQVEVVNSPDEAGTYGQFTVAIDGTELVSDTNGGDAREISGEYIDQNTDVSAYIADTNSAFQYGEYRVRTVLTCVAGEGFEPPVEEDRPNSGAGNGGEGGDGEAGDVDPGNSGGNNNAPDSPPGQAED